MRDLDNARSSANSEVSEARVTEPSPGKSTLISGLRGLDAPVATSRDPMVADAPASPAPATRGLSATSIDLLFGSTRRGLPGGPLGERQAVRGGDGDATPATPASPAPTDGGTPAPAGPTTPAPAPTPAVTITSTTTAGPTFGPQGAAMWHVAFSTTGRTGWIVQKIDNTVTGTDASGGAMTPATIGLAPHYYEAWSVSSTGAVTPAVSGDNDYWDQGGMGARTKGTWSTTGALHWIAGATRPGGMAAGAVPNAGILVSSYSAPPGLGPVLLNRQARGTWDATVTPPVDTGSAS